MGQLTAIAVLAAPGRIGPAQLEVMNRDERHATTCPRVNTT